MTKNKITLIIFIFCFLFLPTQAKTVIPPRPAHTYYFTQIEMISEDSNKATVFMKQSNFNADDYDEAGRISLSAGYSIKKYSDLDSLSAIPMLSFEYNPEIWTLYEDEKENQILKNKKDPTKEIIIFGDKNNIWLNHLNLTSLVKNNTVEINDYSQYGDYTYVFGQSKDNNFEYYYTFTPEKIILKSTSSISENDKVEFKNIVETLNFSKQGLGTLAHNTYVYPQGDYPRLFYSIDDVIGWEEHKHKIIKYDNCEFKWPDYVEYFDNNKCLPALVGGINQIECYDAIGLSEPKIQINTFYGSEISNAEEYLKQYSCNQKAEFFFNLAPRQTIVEKNDPNVSPIVKDFEQAISQCLKTNFDIYSNIDENIQVYTLHSLLNIVPEDQSTEPKKGYPTVFHLSELQPDKTTEKGKNSNFLLYPYSRIYTIKFDNSENYLKLINPCLSMYHHNNWIYIGNSDDYAILVEYIPDENKKINNYLSTHFSYNILSKIYFNDVDYTPLENCSIYSTEMECPQIKSEDYETIINFNSNYQYNNFDKIPDKEIYPPEVKYYTKYFTEIPKDVIATIDNHFDTPPNYQKENDIFFVGQNDDCEKNEDRCIDKGSPWDRDRATSYTAKDKTPILMFILFCFLLFSIPAYIFIINIKKFKNKQNIGK
ncbi:MAG: hypothetical protein COU28_00160 [Candidatus Magasanikbacteria bacterium CG10_big_fil_rev_8_21_14_0_10_36_16]|uniref:Uncharacterized protein n=1 Tax=Candidatus Magasanikbacteria bacterium CG10_big_fil_rev_8_21_14_0_10_36_16 TaxID=1974645 RepID=A0A2H0U1I3_9BACT|nr:MAG: hypothetical protein COU28_00160 [Candidatus Magasanikbacteria bacterium CG10_big_fil_rev_8_21_14_0_10_36_16]